MLQLCIAANHSHAIVMRLTNLVPNKGFQYTAAGKVTSGWWQKAVKMGQACMH